WTLLINHEEILYQFTRGKEGVNMFSGRFYIWNEFYNFIKQNLFWGNNSYKYFIDYFGKRAHAHSSFLQILATHGIFITILYLILIVKNLNKINFPFVLVMLIYSTSQYGIFWGFSMTDIVLFILIFNTRIDNEKDPNFHAVDCNIYIQSSFPTKRI
ncbi:O-antigen ligase like membrane protein, partial [Bacteroidales bacterium 6E]